MTGKEAEEALERYGNMVYRLAVLKTGTSQDAEDIFQEVFLRLVQRKEAFANEEHLKAWLLRVTLNRSNSLWKSPWRQRTVSLNEAAGQLAYRSEEEGDVLEMVLRLPPAYRTIIHLFYYEDLTLDQISGVLGISYHAAAKRLSRAREMLKLAFGEGEISNERFSEKIPREG